MAAVCIAFKAHMGWINAVAVDAAKRQPLPLHAERLQLFDNADREVIEPYHVAGGWQGLERVPRPADPAAVVRRGRRGQARAAVARLTSFRESLVARDLQWQRAVVLTTRGLHGRDLEESLNSHAHIHVAEAEAVRDATRSALEELGIPQVGQDEKSIAPACAELLKLTDCDAYMKGVRPEGSRFWSKEERIIGLGAWMHR